MFHLGLAISGKKLLLKLIRRIDGAIECSSGIPVVSQRRRLSEFRSEQRRKMLGIPENIEENSWNSVLKHVFDKTCCPFSLLDQYFL
jgi:hypothetical protein